MNPTQEEMIAKAQSQNQLPFAVRRGRSIAEHIEAVVRGLFQREHRVVRLTLQGPEMSDLAAFASTQPGQKLSANGYHHDEIGYMPVSSDPALDGHVGFVLPGAELPGGHDAVTVFAHPDEHHTAVISRFVDFKKGFAVPAITKSTLATPAVEGEANDGASEDLGASTEAAQGEGGEPGTTPDDPSGAPTVEAPSVVSGVPTVDDAGEADVPGGDTAPVDVSTAGVEGKAAEASTETMQATGGELQMKAEADAAKAAKTKAATKEKAAAAEVTSGDTPSASATGDGTAHAGDQPGV